MAALIFIPAAEAASSRFEAPGWHFYAPWSLGGGRTLIDAGLAVSPCDGGAETG
jgi:hypothetical protein